MTPSSETFSLTTILAVALLLAAGRLGRLTSIRRFAQTSTRPPIGSQLDSLAGKAIREPEFRHLPYHSRITHSRHRTAIGGVTIGHQAGRFRIREDDAGVCRTPEDTSPPRAGP